MLAGSRIYASRWSMVWMHCSRCLRPHCGPHIPNRTFLMPAAIRAESQASLVPSWPRRRESTKQCTRSVQGLERCRIRRLAFLKVTGRSECCEGTAISAKQAGPTTAEPHEAISCADQPIQMQGAVRAVYSCCEILRCTGGHQPAQASQMM